MAVLSLSVPVLAQNAQIAQLAQVAQLDRRRPRRMPGMRPALRHGMLSSTTTERQASHQYQDYCRTVARSSRAMRSTAAFLALLAFQSILSHARLSMNGDMWRRAFSALLERRLRLRERHSTQT